MKYSLPTGEVVDIDIEDILEIDFTTTEGKEVLQTIYYMKDKIKKYSDFDEAIENDTLKFFDMEWKSLDDEEEDFEINEEIYEKSVLYFEQIQQQQEED